MDKKEQNEQLYQLFRRCYDAGHTTRREQTRIPSPWYADGYIEDPWPVMQQYYDLDEWAHFGNLPTWKSRPSAGKAFQAVETYTTQLTDSKPKAAFYPREADDEPLAAVVQGYYDYWWDIAQGNRAIYLAVKDSRKFGVGWLHLSWDSDKKCQRLFALHPETIVVDPDCTADDFDPGWLIYEYVAQVGALKAAFPKADWEGFKADADAGLGMWQRILKRFSFGNSSVKNPATSTTVYEFWLRDPEQIIWDEDSEALGVTVKKAKAKYPNGRIITIAGGVVIDDRPSPYKHSEFPFVPIHAYPETGKFYSHSDIGNMLPSIMLHNRTMQHLIDATIKSSGGIYLVNKLFGLSKHSITNDVAQVREVSDVDRALRVVTPPSPPRHLFDMGAALEKNIDDIAGIHDISRGVFTPGNKTVTEVDALTQSDQTRTRMAARNLTIALQMLGAQWLSNVAQFEDKKRVVRVSGEDGRMESVEFEGKLLRAGEGDEWTLTQLDIMIDDSSTLPQRQRERHQLALELHSRQAIDTEELLSVVGWPNYKAIIARMKPPVSPQETGAPQGAPPALMPPQGVPPEMMPQMPPEGAVDGMMPQLPPEILAMAAEQGLDPANIPPELLAQLTGGVEGAVL